MRPYRHTDFDAAFTPDTIFQCPTRGRFRVRQEEIGDLVLPSGAIVACDPSNLAWESNTVPFESTVPPGKYPTTLSWMTLGEEQVRDQRVACAGVRFTTSKPVSWEPAVLPGQDASTLPVGKIFGYGVDAGLGCFIDKETLRAIPDLDDEFYFRRVLGEIDKGNEYRDWANIAIGPESEGNLVVFSSGYGDGA